MNLDDFVTTCLRVTDYHLHAKAVVLLGVVSTELTLVALKLFGVLPWPWGLVLSPFWLGFSLALFFVTFVLAVFSLAGVGMYGWEKLARHKRLKGWFKPF